MALQKQFELKWVIFFAFPINLKKSLFLRGEATIQIPFKLITYSLGSWPPLSMKVEEKGEKKNLDGFGLIYENMQKFEHFSRSYLYRLNQLCLGEGCNLAASGFLLAHL